MTEHIVLQPVHLGSGEEGQQRKRALESIAAREGFFWNDKPSIGRWLVAVADIEIENPRLLKVTLKEEGDD